MHISHATNVKRTDMRNLPIDIEISHSEGYKPNSRHILEYMDVIEKRKAYLRRKKQIKRFPLFHISLINSIGKIKTCEYDIVIFDEFVTNVYNMHMPSYGDYNIISMTNTCGKICKQSKNCIFVDAMFSAKTLKIAERLYKGSFQDCTSVTKQQLSDVMKLPLTSKKVQNKFQRSGKDMYKCGDTIYEITPIKNMCVYDPETECGIFECIKEYVDVNAFLSEIHKYIAAKKRVVVYVSTVADVSLINKQVQCAADKDKLDIVCITRDICHTDGRSSLLDKFKDSRVNLALVTTALGVGTSFTQNNLFDVAFAKLKFGRNTPTIQDMCQMVTRVRKVQHKTLNIHVQCIGSSATDLRKEKNNDKPLESMMTPVAYDIKDLLSHKEKEYNVLANSRAMVRQKVKQIFQKCLGYLDNESLVPTEPQYICVENSVKSKVNARRKRKYHEMTSGLPDNHVQPSLNRKIKNIEYKVCRTDILKDDKLNEYVYVQNNSQTFRPVDKIVEIKTTDIL